MPHLLLRALSFLPKTRIERMDEILRLHKRTFGPKNELGLALPVISRPAVQWTPILESGLRSKILVRLPPSTAMLPLLFISNSPMKLIKSLTTHDPGPASE